jgi:four helix bundle protein
MGEEPKSSSRKAIESYRDLAVWQRGMDLVVLAYELAQKLPAQEMYGLRSQIQRSAVSVPANIAEGHGRRHTGDFIHHLSIANGSLKELETLLLIAVRLGFLEPTEIEPAMRLAERISQMLTVLVRRLRERIRVS